MEIKTTITYRGAIAAFGTRAINDVLRQAFMAAGQHWGRHFLMKHFTRAGAREYGYEPRKGENARPGSKRFKRIAGPEEKRMGQILPLVYSGQLRRAAAYYRVTAAATSKRVYTTVTLPQAHGFNRLDEKYRGDISRISDAELKVLTELINARIASGLNDLDATRTVRIG